ncbi:MAG: 4-hydroxy-3-methylbut-2-enyl diphosphate reductase [Rikenellaceae bacterium]
MRVEIDPQSGFCFGVVRAIEQAEQNIQEYGEVYSLGDIVHNRVEVQRLEDLGLRRLSILDMERAKGARVLIRAHGEPPSTYAKAASLAIPIIDATCPVVANLQKKVKRAHEQMSQVGGEVVLLGKRGHAEVVGLTGQVDDQVIVIEGEEDMELIDFSRPIYFLSQTTQSISLFDHLANIMTQRSDNVTVCDTICRRVSSREANLVEFARKFDLVLFVSGKKSSNGKVLFELCHEANPNAYTIEDEFEIEPQWLEGIESVGICGATSTPTWLMQRVAKSIENIKN